MLTAPRAPVQARAMVSSPCTCPARRDCRHSDMRRCPGNCCATETLTTRQSTRPWPLQAEAAGTAPLPHHRRLPRHQRPSRGIFAPHRRLGRGFRADRPAAGRSLASPCWKSACPGPSPWAPAAPPRSPTSSASIPALTPARPSTPPACRPRTSCCSAPWDAAAGWLSRPPISRRRSIRPTRSRCRRCVWPATCRASPAKCRTSPQPSSTKPPPLPTARH